MNNGLVNNLMIDLDEYLLKELKEFYSKEPDFLFHSYLWRNDVEQCLKGNANHIAFRYPGPYIGCYGKTKEKYASQLKLLGWSVKFYELYDVCEPGSSYQERMAKEFEGLSWDEI